MPSRRLPLAAVAALLAGCGADPRPQAATAVARRPVEPGGAGGKGSKPPSESSPALVRKADKALDSRDYAAAFRLYEQAVAVEPTNRRALLQLALLAEQSALELPRPQGSPWFLRSAEMIRRLRSAYPALTREEWAALPRILYDEACTLALNGESARAVAVLAESINAGFNDIAHIEADPDLDSLRKLPEYLALMRGLESLRARVLISTATPFPFDFRLDDLDQKPFALADLKGKVVVVNFWGTWCPPCRKQVPLLVELSRRCRDKGLEVVGLTYENERGGESRKALRAFASEAGITYPCLIGDETTRHQVPGFAGFPTTLFIDGSGKVRLTLAGYQPYSSLEAAADVLLGEARGKGKTRNQEKEKAGKPDVAKAKANVAKGR